jgi:hypothetical protein
MPAMKRLYPALLLACLGWLGTLSAATPGARILAVQGKVECQTAGATNWLTAQTNQVLNVRDRFGTAHRRAFHH